VRELQNVIERAVVLSEGETFVIDESWLARKQRKPSTGTAVTTLSDGEKALIEAALTETHGRVAARAARRRSSAFRARRSSGKDPHPANRQTGLPKTLMALSRLAIANRLARSAKALAIA